MKKEWLVKTLALSIIVLFIGAGFIPLALGTIKEKNVLMNLGSRGYIQGLIDNASDGDTIYIPSGTYYENIIIDKSISLIGEDKNTTIIDGRKRENVVYISTDWVNISGFTIQNSKEGYGYLMYAGIYINSNKSTIIGNTISNNHYGIFIDILWYPSNNNTIKGNTISNNQEDGININGNNNTVNNNIISNNKNDGIELGGYSDNNITGNTITSNDYNGIFLSAGSENIIKDNYVSKNWRGIELEGSCDNNITSNTISKNIDGIYLEEILGGPPIYNYLNSERNTILKNNFLLNIRHAHFSYFRFNWDLFSNSWDRNYWNRPRILPEIIFGLISDVYPSYTVPWITIDWHPAKEPYDI